MAKRLKFPFRGLIGWEKRLNDTGVRAESDGSSDKHTGNERERLMDSTGPPLMGSLVSPG